MLKRLVQPNHGLCQLSGLHACIGDGTRRPLSCTTASVQAAAEQIGRALELSPAEALAHHPATSWRYHLLREIGRRAEDPDVEATQWL